MEMIAHFKGRIPILGVCLGHQSIATVFGGEVVSAKGLMHGKDSPVYHETGEASTSVSPTRSRRGGITPRGAGVGGPRRVSDRLVHLRR